MEPWLSTRGEVTLLQGDFGLFQCSEPCCRQTWAVHAFWVLGTVRPSMDKCEAEAGVVPDPEGEALARLLF